MEEFMTMFLFNGVFISTVMKELKYQWESFEQVETGENGSNSLFWIVEVFVREDWFTGITCEKIDSLIHY